MSCLLLCNVKANTLISSKDISFYRISAWLGSIVNANQLCPVNLEMELAQNQHIDLSSYNHNGMIRVRFSYRTLSYSVVFML